MSYQEIVTYKNASAYYQINREDGNVLVAKLQHYLGNKEHMPPKTIVFTSAPDQYKPCLLEDMAKALRKLA